MYVTSAVASSLPGFPMQRYSSSAMKTRWNRVALSQENASAYSCNRVVCSATSCTHPTRASCCRHNRRGRHRRRLRPSSDRRPQKSTSSCSGPHQSSHTYLADGLALSFRREQFVVAVRPAYLRHDNLQVREAAPCAYVHEVPVVPRPVLRVVVRVEGNPIAYLRAAQGAVHPYRRTAPGRQPDLLHLGGAVREHEGYGGGVLYVGRVHEGQPLLEPLLRGAFGKVPLAPATLATQLDISALDAVVVVEVHGALGNYRLIGGKPNGDILVVADRVADKQRVPRVRPYRPVAGLRRAVRKHVSKIHLGFNVPGVYNRDPLLEGAFIGGIPCRPLGE